MKKVGKWQISLTDNNRELVITNQLETCYAFFNMRTDTLYFDRIICPKSVQEAAKKYGRANGMVDIYND